MYAICFNNSLEKITDDISNLKKITSKKANARYQSGRWPLEVYEVDNATAEKLDIFDPDDEEIFELLEDFDSFSAVEKEV